jgi:hypothetical protein
MFEKKLRALRRALRMLHASRQPLNADVPNDGTAYSGVNAYYRRIRRRSSGAFRPAYTWGVLHSAHMARVLGIERISVVEFGVAGGNGLMALDRLAPLVHEALGVAVDVYGFDTGSGLPPPTDYRDLPNLFAPGTYIIDEVALRKNLKNATLIIGDIADTIGPFMQSAPSPIGFIAVDVDFYRSTVECLKIFELDQRHLLPRVHCFFDDVLGFTYSHDNGERLAINEFNERRNGVTLSPIFGLRHYVPRSEFHANWTEKMFLAHVVGHDLYTRPDGLITDPEKPLSIVGR